MPDLTEPINPARRKRHVVRWIILGMALVIFAAAFVVFKWGDSENMPSFAKIWLMRGKILFNQISYGSDNRKTREAKVGLAHGLAMQGSYEAAENQYRAIMSSEERVRGTNSLVFPYPYCRLWIADCLFLQGKKEAAAFLMRTELKRYFSPSPRKKEVFYPDFYILSLHLAGNRKELDALSLAKFTLEQGQQVFKDDPAMLRVLEGLYQGTLQMITNATPSRPPAR